MTIPASMKYIRVYVLFALFCTLFLSAATVFGEFSAYAKDDSLPVEIVNGDFEYPEGILDTENDSAYIDPANARYVYCSAQYTVYDLPDFSSAAFGWSSSETGDGTGTFPLNWPGIVELQRDITGNQYSEIYASEADRAIYQDIATTPGAIYVWELKHASITDQYEDEMQVLIGSADDTDSLEAQSATRISVNGNGDALGPVGTTISTKVSNTDRRDHSDQWETYTGTYLIPEGQYTTRFSFKSISNDYQGDREGRSLGNEIDDILFAIAYPLFYDLNGGSSSDIYTDPTQNDYQGYHAADQTVILTESQPTREGYRFLGWSMEKLDDADSYRAYLENKDSVVDAIKMPAKATTVYAVWAEDPIVTFVDGLTEEDIDTQSVAYESAANEPAAPEHTGYDFVGWDKSFDFITESITVTAEYTPKTTTITINKIWDDDENRDGQRRDVTFEIIGTVASDGKTIEAVKTTVTLEAEGNASLEVKDLPAYQDLLPIEYAIAEQDIDGYTAAISDRAGTWDIGYTFDVTNTHAVETCSIVVNKIWDDEDDQDGLRPDSLGITLAGSDGSSYTASLDADNGWSYTFADIPVFFNAGETIEYTLEEQAVEGYVASIEKTDAGFTVTNTHEPEIVEEVKEADDDSSDETNPDESTETKTTSTTGKASPSTSATSTYDKTGFDLFPFSLLIAALVFFAVASIAYGIRKGKTAASAKTTTVKR